MLHRSCNDAIIANNVVYDNGDAGVALFESANTEVYGNTLTNNKCEHCFSHHWTSNFVSSRCRLLLSSLESGHRVRGPLRT